MNSSKSVLLLLLLLLTGVCYSINPGADGYPGFPSDQTYIFSGGYADLMSWSEESVEDAYYGRSNVPLVQNRFRNSALQANPHARADEAEVFFLSQTSVVTNGQSLRPTHGYTWPDIWAFSFWQYVNSCGVWNIPYGCGGNYMLPPPDFVDAAHRNGVPVYALMGQGSSSQWDLLFDPQPDGSFPVADKMVDICEYYGFDGYFINFETTTTSAQAALLRDFMIYFQFAAEERNLDLRLHWYDAVNENGQLVYRNALVAQNDWFFQHESDLTSEEMFLNYWYTPTHLINSRTNAQNLGRSEFDVYAGVEVEMTANDILNTTANAAKWAMIFPEGEPHRTSIAWFNPDAVTFRHASDNEDYYLRSSQYWSGQNGNPADTETSWHWRGMANYVPAWSPITSVPFVSNFCTGHGDSFYVEGVNLRVRPWSNRSFQDVMPTWRWITDLDVEVDFSDAYYGGNCLTVSGNVSSDTDMKLFMTQLPVTATTNLQVAFKMGEAGVPSHMQVGIAFEGSESTFHYLDAGNSLTDEWDLKTFSLGSYAGSTIAVISVRFLGTAGSGYEIKLGRIGVIDGDVDIPAAAANLTVDRLVEDISDNATLRLSWTHSPDNEAGTLYYYNVYRRNPDNSLTHLGGATSDAYFVPEVLRVGSEASTTIELETVNKEFGHSTHTTTTFSWGTGIESGGSPSPAELSFTSGNPSFGALKVLAVIPVTGTAQLRVYDLSGRVVAVPMKGEQIGGEHSLVLNNLPSGIYTCVLETAGDQYSSRVTVLR